MPTYSDWIHCFTSLKAEVFVSSTLFFYHFYICMSFFNHFLYPYLYYSFSIRMLFPISLSSLILLFHPLYIFIAVCHPLYHFFLSVYSPFSDRVELHISFYIIIMLSPISFLYSNSLPHIIVITYIFLYPNSLPSYHCPPLYNLFVSSFFYLIPSLIYFCLSLHLPLYHFVSTSSPISFCIYVLPYIIFIFTSSPILFLSLRPPLYIFIFTSSPILFYILISSAISFFISILYIICSSHIST